MTSQSQVWIKLRDVEIITASQLQVWIKLRVVRVESVGVLAANVPVALSKVPPSKRLILVGRTFDLRSAYPGSGVVAGHH